MLVGVPDLVFGMGAVQLEVVIGADGASLDANIHLVVNNARLAPDIAIADTAGD